VSIMGKLHFIKLTRKLHTITESGRFREVFGVRVLALDTVPAMLVS